MMNKIVSTYLHPFKEIVVRFDFEVDGEDEGLLRVLPMLGGKGGS
jgi:hypothetical protein